MKYCSRCGAQLDDNAQVCPHCGLMQDGQPVNKNNSNYDAMCVVGFILSFFAPIAGLIVSIIANSKVKETPYASGAGLAKAGIIISAVRLAFDAFLIFSFCFPVVMLLLRSTYGVVI